MPPRLFLDLPLAAGERLALPPEPARHVQVLRLQPGDPLCLFDGRGGEWRAEVAHMGGRQQVEVLVHAHLPASRELPVEVTLALGMPANERMDALVEKATELGVAALQPLQCARSVLKLVGERAERRQAHWQAVAVSAAEQSGRTRVPVVHPVRTPAQWLAELDGPAALGERAGPGGTGGAALAGGTRHLLCFAPDARPASVLAAPAAGPVWLMSGPEGGLTPQEEDLARQHGFQPLSLGPRVLRADTAPLAALVLLGAGR